MSLPAGSTTLITKLSIDAPVSEELKGLCASCAARLIHAAIDLVLETPPSALTTAQTNPYRKRLPVPLEICPRSMPRLMEVVNGLRPWRPLAFLIEWALAELHSTRSGPPSTTHPLASLRCWQGAADEDGHTRT